MKRYKAHRVEFGWNPMWGYHTAKLYGDGQTVEKRDCGTKQEAEDWAASYEFTEYTWAEVTDNGRYGCE